MSKRIERGLGAGLVLALLAGSAQAAVVGVDYHSYGKADTVVKKIFKLSGDFGTCGGSGNPDTEVRTFKNTDLGGGVTQEVQTRIRYVGGPKGTKCVTLKTTFIKTPTDNILVEQKKYNKAGTLVQYLKTDYDAATCPTCAMVLGTSTMQEGIDFASAGGVQQIDYTPSTVKTDGLVLEKNVLTRSGFDETVLAGTAAEATYTNCIEVWEDRRTATDWGNRTQMRRVCQDIGMVVSGQVDTSSGTPVERVWELKSYIVKP